MDSVNIVVATPSSGQTRFIYAMSLARMVAYFAQVKSLPEIKTQQMDFIGLEGSGISANREWLVREALKKEDMTHILFIDDDMGFNPQTLNILISRRQPIVGCNYRIRVPPGDFTAVSLDGSSRVPTNKDKGGLEEVYYSGFGFCLIERKVFEAIDEPRFMIKYFEDQKYYSTEDSPFFEKAKEKGFPCYIDHDASKHVWHQGIVNYSWNNDYSNLGQGFGGKDGK
jgi:hypothetical protein